MPVTSPAVYQAELGAEKVGAEKVSGQKRCQEPIALLVPDTFSCHDTFSCRTFSCPYAIETQETLRWKSRLRITRDNSSRNLSPLVFLVHFAEELGIVFC